MLGDKERYSLEKPEMRELHTLEVTVLLTWGTPITFESKNVIFEIFSTHGIKFLVLPKKVRIFSTDE